MTGGTNRGWNFIQNTTVVAGIDATGHIRTVGTWTGYSSDSRLKDNKTLISNPIEKIMAIGGYEYDWNLELCKELGFTPANDHEHGVIAQELQEIIPDAVTTAPFNENYFTVKHEKIIPLLIEVDKNQERRIQSLEAEVEALKELVTTLMDKRVA